jgi:hypothetical protein
MKPSNKERQVLEKFATHGALSARDLAGLIPHFAALEETCEDLVGSLHLSAIRTGRHPVYSITYRGRNWIGKTKKPSAQYEDPAPRGPMTFEVWNPPKHAPARAGADDHIERCLSRRGNTFVEHRGPISMSGIES